MRRTRTSMTLLALAAMALLVTGTAIAAAPTPGGSYGDCTSASCKASLKVSANGKKVRTFSAYTKCNPVPFRKLIGMPISSAGAFFTGTLTDVTGGKVKVEITGEFVSKTRARGTMRYSTATCNSKTLKYNAVLGKGTA